jgi:hypothetical protein
MSGPGQDLRGSVRFEVSLWEIFCVGALELSTLFGRHRTHKAVE